MQWQLWAMIAHHCYLILSFRLKIHLKIILIKSNLINEMKSKIQVKAEMNLVSLT